ncbi:DUF5397 family protein [Avibacterium gallinarum]|uniref:DUF5397 family protein n=1 Tax=Avibacterium gallinarum TaxID=755 RepID=UPI0039FBBE43
MDITQIPVGAVKTFGAYGVPYKVEDQAKVLDDGDILVNITLIQTGEKEHYKLSKLLNDPDAE